MFHAISARLARLARQITDRQALPFDYATWYGWQARRIGWGTWEFRDPRFGRFAAARTAPATASRTWAQAATADRIRALGPMSMGPGKSAWMHRKLTEAMRQHRPIAVIDGKQPGRWS